MVHSPRNQTTRNPDLMSAAGSRSGIITKPNGPPCPTDVSQCRRCYQEIVVVPVEGAENIAVFGLF